MPGIFSREERDEKRAFFLHERIPMRKSSEVSALRPHLRIPTGPPNSIRQHAIKKCNRAIAPEQPIFPRLFAHNLIKRRRIAWNLLISIPREKQHRIADRAKRAVWLALSIFHLIIPLEPIACLLQKNALIRQQFKVPLGKAVLQICQGICNDPTFFILLSVPSAHQKNYSFSWLPAISRSIASSV